MENKEKERLMHYLVSDVRNLIDLLENNEIEFENEEVEEVVSNFCTYWGTRFELNELD